MSKREKERQIDCQNSLRNSLSDDGKAKLILEGITVPPPSGEAYVNWRVSKRGTSGLGLAIEPTSDAIFDQL